MQANVESAMVAARGGSFASLVKLVTRLVATVTLLLTLVGGNLVLTATASSDLCALACCAGRAPHAAGSCMQGSCAPTHAHHESATDEESTDTPTAFAGATAGAHGTDLENVPTVDASAETGSTDNSAASNFSIASAAKPCQPDCGACASTFSASKGSGHFAARPGSHLSRRPRAISIVSDSNLVVSPRSGFAKDCNPRGPPAFV